MKVMITSQKRTA